MSDAERLNTVETNELITQGQDIEPPQPEFVPSRIEIQAEGVGTLVVDPERFVYKPVGVFLDGALSWNAVKRAEEDPNAPAPVPRDLLIPYGKINYIEFFFEEVDEDEEDGDD